MHRLEKENKNADALLRIREVQYYFYGVKISGEESDYGTASEKFSQFSYEDSNADIEDNTDNEPTTKHFTSPYKYQKEENDDDIVMQENEEYSLRHRDKIISMYLDQENENGWEPEYYNNDNWYDGDQNESWGLPEGPEEAEITNS